VSSMRPPRIARAWLRRSLPVDAREHIGGDLEERSFAMSRPQAGASRDGAIAGPE
jgi:hypothetical protein